MKKLLGLLLAVFLIHTAQCQSLSVSTTWAEDCNGNCDAYVVLSGNGGTPPYQFSEDGLTWQANDTIDSLCSGVYTYYIQDATLAVDSITDTVWAIANFELDTILVQNGSGNGACDGEITIMLSGGFPGYAFSLDNGPWQTSNVFTGVCPGMHTVDFMDTTALDCSSGGGGGGGGSPSFACDTITFNYGPSVNGQVFQNCHPNGASSSGSANVAIGDGPLTVTAIWNDDDWCNCDGSYSGFASGGVPPYSYDFGDGNGFVSANTAGNLCGGTNYTLTAMDATGQTAIDVVFIGGGFGYVPTAINSSNPQCSLCDGIIELDVAPFPASYSIDGGASSQGSPVFSGLCAGTYDLAVVHPNGCIYIGGQVTLINGAGTLSATEITTDVLCFGECSGTLSIIASGGTAPLNFTLIGTGQSNSNGTFGGLCPGTVQYVVTDAAGCAFNSTAPPINEPTLLNTAPFFTDPSCGGLCDGTVTLVTSGGTPPYIFELDGNLNTTGTFSGLCGGTYAWAVTDANGCIIFGAQTLADPNQLTASETITPPGCTGVCDGSISIVANGGTPPYLYSFDGINNSTGSFTNVCAGTYTFTVTDINGCSVTSSTLSIVAASNLSASEIVTNETCSGLCDGTLQITPISGTAPYSYTLNGSITNGTGLFAGLCPGSYSYLLTDAAGCQLTVSNSVVGGGTTISTAESSTPPTCFGGCDGTISISASGGALPLIYTLAGNSNSTGIFNGLCSAAYSYVVTDANGCSATSAVTLNGPPANAGAAITLNPLCAGDNSGEITISSVSGTSPFQYSIDGGTTLQSSGNFTGLLSGNYHLFIQDANGCIWDSLITITDPTPLSITSFSTTPSTSVSCDGTIDIDAFGGTPPYIYSFDDGVTWNTNDLATNLCAGTFILWIQDANGCMITGDTTILTPPSNVWPGDANADSIANNWDWLFVGLAYNYSATPRQNPSILWQAWPSADWPGGFLFGPNYKHADSNGLGSVEADDTTAIIHNYNQLHGPEPMWVDMSSSADPLLYLVPQNFNPVVSDTLLVDIFAGTGNTPVDSLHGIAFSINYDTTVVDSASVWIEYGPSWIGTPGANAFAMDYDDYPQARIDGAITRIDHQNSSGHGWIGTLHIIMPDDISGKKRMNVSDKAQRLPLILDTLNLAPTRMVAYSAAEYPLHFRAGEPVTVEVQMEIGIDNQFTKQPSFSVLPNPTSGNVSIRLQGVLESGSISVIDMTGKLVQRENVGAAERIKQLDLTQLENGIYLLRFESHSGSASTYIIKK